MLNHFDALMTFYGQPTPFPDDVVNALPDKLKALMDDLALIQLGYIAMLRRGGFSKGAVLHSIISVDDFTDSIRFAIRGRGCK